MSFEVEGKLHRKFDTENKTETFQTREFVLEVKDGAYAQFVKFQLVQDRCAAVDEYDEGELLKVHFDLRGREWQGRFFTNLNAWRIEKSTLGNAPVPPPATDGTDTDFPTTGDEPPAAEKDDLPF